jgi:hypothetical protein
MSPDAVGADPTNVAISSRRPSRLPRIPGRVRGLVRKLMSRETAEAESREAGRPARNGPEESPGRLGTALLVLLVAIPTIANAIALLPEITSGVPSLNDDAFHYLLVQQASQALAHGGNVLDLWVPQLELGFPNFLYYQTLPHLAVAGLDKLLLGSVDLLTLFNVVRFVLLVGFPLTVYWSMRRMGFSVVAAAFSAAAASLISGNARYGFEYDSYVWRGFGMFTQLWAMHLSFIALACVHRVIERGKGYLPAILALSALVLSHLVYAYMMAITLVVVLLVGASRRTLLPRVARLAIVGFAVLAVTAYMWLPFLSSYQYLGASPYLESWKYDSFGAPTILGWLFSGDLLDHGRLPVLTVLLALGIVAALIRRGRLAALALGGFAVWLVLYFGRPTLGPIADLFPLHDGLLFHRFIGGVELFAVILVGIGGSWIWRSVVRLRSARIPMLRPLGRVTVAFAILLAFLVPAVAERIAYYADNTLWMSQTRDAIDADPDMAAILATLASEPGGRAYAGLRTNWGSQLAFGSVRATDLLTFHAIPAVSPPYQSLSLNADMIWDFQDGEEAQYDLLDVRYVVTPSSYTVPAFYQPLQRTARYTLYRVPTSGAAEYVSITARRSAPTQRALFDGNIAWFRGADATNLRFIRWDYLAPVGPQQTSAGCPDGGHTLYERDEVDAVHLVVECSAASPLVIKVTYHPNWHVTVDGQPVPTYMLSPSFVGVDLPAGRHTVDAVYVATPSKLPLLGLGLVVLLVVLVLRRRLDAIPRRMSRVGRPSVARPYEDNPGDAP